MPTRSADRDGELSAAVAPFEEPPLRPLPREPIAPPLPTAPDAPDDPTDPLWVQEPLNPFPTEAPPPAVTAT